MTRVRPYIVSVLYLPHRFREVVEHLELHNHWKFWRIGLA